MKIVKYLIRYSKNQSQDNIPDTKPRSNSFPAILQCQCKSNTLSNKAK